MIQNYTPIEADCPRKTLRSSCFVIKAVVVGKREIEEGAKVEYREDTAGQRRVLRRKSKVAEPRRGICF